MTRLPNADRGRPHDDERLESLPAGGNGSRDLEDPHLGGADPSSLQKAVESIVMFIPTEIVTVYVAASAAIDLPDQGPAGGQWLLFWITVALTPLVAWAGYAQAAIVRGEQVPLLPSAWPRQRMVVAVIAFLIWGFGLPNTPFETFEWFRPGLAAVVLLVGTMLIGLVAPLLPEMRERASA